MLMLLQKTPDLVVPILDRCAFDLTTENSSRSTAICYYRGYHCPICASYLKDIERHLEDFTNGVMDQLRSVRMVKKRARAMTGKIKASALRIGNGMSLFIKRSRS